jgi:hypothetical protein
MGHVAGVTNRIVGYGSTWRQRHRRRRGGGGGGGTVDVCCNGSDETLPSPTHCPRAGAFHSTWQVHDGLPELDVHARTGGGGDAAHVGGGHAKLFHPHTMRTHLNGRYVGCTTREDIPRGGTYVPREVRRHEDQGQIGRGRLRDDHVITNIHLVVRSGISTPTATIFAPSADMSMPSRT